WQGLGPFKTVGWVDDTSGLGAGAMDEEQFLAAARTHMRFTADALKAVLREREQRLVIAVFTSTDRIAHMFYRYVDAEHPAAPGGAGPLATAIDDSYVEMDRIIGEVHGLLAPADTLVVMSDHGFDSFRRGVNLNTWLVREGFLAVKRGVREPRDFFRDVDWSRSKAYALGTGAIYLNRADREAQGIVTAAQAAAIVQAIEQGLAGLRDGKTRVVSATYRGDQIFAGPLRRNAPDLRVAVASGYRASWATSLGGMPRALLEDNDKKWSGDHASSRPEDVPGILVSNRRVHASSPRLEDIAATAFAFFGVPAPSGLAGRPLFE
ncbi:MAG: alkaline phosphatase family protein, partial [Deltaproteobacteria bacterium]|nr:alkaline phosphatase family protein [Deltaproteobacteria bacterium]